MADKSNRNQAGVNFALAQVAEAWRQPNQLPSLCQYCELARYWLGMKLQHRRFFAYANH
jgi:hypothetical protein